MKGVPPLMVSLISFFKSGEKVSGATTGLPSHNSTSQGVWKNPCVDSHKKKTQMNVGGYWYTSRVCVYVCVSQHLKYPIWCWSFYSLRYHIERRPITKKGSMVPKRNMQVFMYDTGSGWLPSDIYTWPDMIQVLMEPSKWGCWVLVSWKTCGKWILTSKFSDNGWDVLEVSQTQ